MFPARARGQTAQNKKKKYKNQVASCLHRQLVNFKMDKLDSVIIGLQRVQRVLLSQLSARIAGDDRALKG